MIFKVGDIVQTMNCERFFKDGMTNGSKGYIANVENYGVTVIFYSPVTFCNEKHTTLIFGKASMAELLKPSSANREEELE